MSADDAIRDVLEKFGENFNDKGTVWRVQGTAVISHKALERIAAKAGIKYALPTIIRSERDEAVLLVSGTLGERMEWSIGEALVNVNYRVSGKQAGYVWAMAEKRAKDRVILKLVSLHGLAYSEEEADEFKGSGHQNAKSDSSSADEIAQKFLGECRTKIAAFTDVLALKSWWGSPDRETNCETFQLNDDEIGELFELVKTRIGELQRRAAA